jgi:hypothetical protein
MRDPSQNSEEKTFEDTRRSISSAESWAGPTLWSWQDGPVDGPSGRDLVRANLSRRRASAREKPTTDISGLRCDDSSPSAVLQRSLESRLRARLDVNGSPEYVLTWKHWAMQSGVPICALRARARRTSDSAFSGRPTPATRDWKGATDERWGTNARPLNEVAVLAGWPNPTAIPEARGGASGQSGKGPGEDSAGPPNQPGRRGGPGGLGHADSRGLGQDDSSEQPRYPSAASFWSDFDILPCRDGKARRVKSGVNPLAHGVPGRVAQLRGLGNSIVPQVATTFIEAFLEAESEVT